MAAMLLSSIEARAWSDNNNGDNQAKKEDDFNKKPGDMFNRPKDDKVARKDHFSSDTPLVLPTPSKPSVPSNLQRQHKPFDINSTQSGSNSPKIVVFKDNPEAAKPKETPPMIKRSEAHVGGRFLLESVTFDSSFRSDLKAHHNYVEKTYPFSWGIEAALHRLQKYIYWNMGAFGQIDWAHKLSEKNKLDQSASFGLLGHIGLSELIHINHFRIIPTIGVEFNVSGLFKSVDLSVGGSLYVVYQNVYVRIGAYLGFVPETFTLKNNDTDAEDSLKVSKRYGILAIGYWQ